MLLRTPPRAAALAAALSLVLAGCGAPGVSQDPTTPVASASAPQSPYTDLVAASARLLGAEGRAVAVPQELIASLGTLAVSADVGDAPRFAPALTTADLDPAAAEAAAGEDAGGDGTGGGDGAGGPEASGNAETPENPESPDNPADEPAGAEGAGEAADPEDPESPADGGPGAHLADARELTRLTLAAPDGTRTEPLALADDGSLLATNAEIMSEGSLLAEEPYTPVLIAPGGVQAALPRPEPWTAGNATDTTEPADPADVEAAPPPMQAVHASSEAGRGVILQAPDTDLHTLTWQLAVGGLDGSPWHVVADAQELLGVDGPIPAFSQGNTPVLAGDVVYHAATLPDPTGPWVWDADGSRWIGGLVAAPADLDGDPGETGAEGPQVLAAGTRLVASDGSDVVHLVDGALVEGAESRRYAIVEQTAAGEGVAWVTGVLPRDSAVTALGVSEDLLVWVISHDAEETATLVVLDRTDGVLRAVELGDVLAAPSVEARRIGWGNASGNGDPGEYLWDVPAGAPIPSDAADATDPAAQGLVRLGENRGASRVRVAGEGGRLLAVSATVGEPATGAPALGAGGSTEAGDVPAGTLEEIVLEVPPAP